MRNALLIILFIFWNALKVNAQNSLIVKHIQDELYSDTPTDLRKILQTLHFSYAKTDTAKGLEIELYYKRNNHFCSYFLFFVEQKMDNDSMRDLQKWLNRHSLSYYYIGSGGFYFNNFCNFLANDSFYYCNNQASFVNENFKPYNKVLYKGYDGNFFISVSNVTAIVDRFVSNDTAYRKRFYHFLDDSTRLNTIHYLHYRKVIERDAIRQKKLFKFKRWEKYNQKTFECSITID